MKISVCAYADYKIKEKCECSVRIGYDQFEKQRYRKQKTINGVKFINYIAKLMSDNETCYIQFEENIIIIEQFNSLTGENCNYKIEYEEVKK